MSSFNLNNRNLTSEQQRLLTMYTNQYNQTNEHINILLDMLEETRGNIINIIYKDNYEIFIKKNIEIRKSKSGKQNVFPKKNNSK